jgi:hypothetical protein
MRHYECVEYGTFTSVHQIEISKSIYSSETSTVTEEYLYLTFGSLNVLCAYKNVMFRTVYICCWVSSGI